MEIGVFAFIRNDENKILFVKDATRQQLWTMPGGGLEFQELVPDALKREVKEEISVDIRVGSLLGVFSQSKNPGIVLLLEGFLESGVPTPDGNETQEVGFFSIEELLQMKDKIKPAQLSMGYQVTCSQTFPIYNHFVSPEGA